MLTKFYEDKIERLVIDGVVDFDDYYSGRGSSMCPVQHCSTFVGGWSKNLKDTDKILQLYYNACVVAGTACPLYANSSSLVQGR
jgi:hypothetical protein